MTEQDRTPEPNPVKRRTMDALVRLAVLQNHVAALADDLADPAAVDDLCLAARHLEAVARRVEGREEDA